MYELDLRDRIIQTRINNTNKDGKIGTEEFDTKDFIYLETYKEWYENMPPVKNREKNKPIITSYARGTRATVPIASRSNSGIIKKDRLCIEVIGAYNNRLRNINDFFGVCPSLRFSIKDTDTIDEFKITEVKDNEGNFLHNRLQIGEYIKNEINDKLRTKLEELYNNGNVKDGMFSTGRCYTKIYNGNIKLLPEFEYNGKKYVREVTKDYYTNIRWMDVKPIKFIIKNWEDLPININPNGSGKDKYFELRAEEAIFTMQFYPKFYEENANMWQNSTIRGFLNGIDVINIQENGNSNFGAKNGGNFKGENNFLNEAFNLERNPITEYAISETETEILDNAFNGCISLNKLTIHNGINKIGKDCFKGLNFKYLYKLKTGEIIFDNKLPEKEYGILIELGNILSNLDGIEIEDIFKEGKLNERIVEFSNNLNKYQFFIPYTYAKHIIDINMEKEFFEDNDFRIFKKEFPNLRSILSNYKMEERIDFFKFAKTLGCFSVEKIKDKEGKETEAFLAQKATSLLARLLKTKEMQLGKYHQLFDSLPFDIKPNQDFLEFISKSKNREFENLNLILKLEEQYPSMFVKVMSNFDELKKYRIGLDENGMPKKVTWEDTLKNFYMYNKYAGITEENKDIAEIIGSRGLSQNIFDQACNLRKKAKQNQISENILDIAISEEILEDSIKKIKENTLEQLEDAQKALEKIYEKQFTYEWLSKNDPHNSIMGLFCSCCGTITSAAYGGNIARASVVSPDVQNLVIRNLNGEIIAKGTMYMNKKESYGVINDFEINSKYKKHEEGIGKYRVSKDSKEERDRELIYEAFRRGIEAFVQEYDKENPKNPINQINIGMGFNRLKNQVERLEKATNKLIVPSEYSFNDAMKNEQYIIYSREKERKAKGEER